MQTRRQALSDAALRLERAGASDARLDAEWLLSHVCGVRRLSLLTELDTPLGPDEAAAFQPLLLRREAGEPLQYVLGETDFFGRTFRVDGRVLIPRPDTEALCEAAVSRLNALPPGSRALDVGTGSGALAVSLQLACPRCRVVGADISADALCVARANGKRLGAAVEWVQSGWFEALSGTFDVIVSNPPYIPLREMEGLQREVRFEPRLALCGGADGLDFYRRIAGGLRGRLAPGGALLLEVGDGQAGDVAALLSGRFEKVDISRDLAGLWRVVTGDGYAG